MRVLDREGILLALFFGAVLFFYGGTAYLTLMLAFFAFAMIATRYGYEVKRELGIYEHERGWENVLSNGLLPAALAVLSSITGPGPFIASIAAVTADKFGSEIGVLDTDQPLSLLDFKPVKPGTSGAMSKLGTVASLGGAALVGFSAMFFFPITPTAALLLSLAGFVGSLADSLFGVLEEKGIGTKGTTNFICSLVGAVIGRFIVP